MGEEKQTGQHGSDLGPANGTLVSAYTELCKSYHAIDDFRAKLLGFLPLASGAGIFLLLSSALSQPEAREYFEQFMAPIGAFGFVVTLGLFAYEIYGIRRCGALIKAGKQVEGQLRVDGQFTSRPRGVARYVNEPFAAGIIYPAVLAAWTFLALSFVLPKIVWLIAILVFFAGFVSMFFYNRRLERN